MPLFQVPLRLLLPLSCICLLAPLAAAQAGISEADCNSYPDVPVTVTPRFDDPAYNFDTGIAGIRALASDAEHSIHENLTLGLTRYEPILQFRIPMRQVRFPDGAACAYVENVDVTFGYRDVTVYIASEIPQGTCGFDEIMAHEQKRIAVNRAILDEYMPAIAERLKEFLRANGVSRERNLDDATATLRDKMQGVLDETIAEIVADNRSRQQGVDNPEEYRRITYACDGQLAGIARQFVASLPAGR